MSWAVQYAQDAQEDIKGIYKYIAFRLGLKESAIKKYHLLVNAIDSLSEMPYRYPIYTKLTLKNVQIRLMVVDQYYVFYEIDEKLATVNIVRVVYRKKDTKNIMNE